MYDRGYWTQMLVGWIIRTVILSLFLLSLRGLLRAVAPKNRAMQPNLVWLNLIPYFDYVWIFVTLVKIRASLRAESATRGWAPRGDSAFTVGLVSAVLYVVAFAVAWLAPLAPEVITVVFPLASLASLGFWIAYWSKISGLKNVLVSLGPGGEDQRRRCPSCGEVLYPGDDFCRSCGSRLNAAALVQDPGAQNTATQDLSGQPPAVKDGDGQAATAETSGASGEIDASAGEAAACPFCGATYRPLARFCSVCGRPAV